MKTSAILLTSLACANAYAPNSNSAPKPMAALKKAAGATFVAATIAANVINPDVAIANDFAMMPNVFQSSNIVVAATETRSGVYKDYDIDLTPQTVDNAESSFKSAKETKSKKGKYTAILAILIVGSFIIPMAQYFWYVKDDSGGNNFFNQQKAPEPEPEPPKKKGWFN